MQPIVVGRLVAKHNNPNHKQGNRWLQGEIILAAESRPLLVQLGQRKLNFAYTTSSPIPDGDVIILGTFSDFKVGDNPRIWKSIEIDHIIAPDADILRDNGISFIQARALIRAKDKDFLELIGSVEVFVKKQIRDILGKGNQFADKLIEYFGSDAYRRLVENPWEMINAIPYFKIEHADKVAQAVGLDKEDPKRFTAIFEQLLSREFATQANTYMNEGAFLAFYFTHFSEDLTIDEYKELAETGDSPIIRSEIGYHPLKLYWAEQATLKFLNQALDPSNDEFGELHELALHHRDLAEDVEADLSFTLTGEQSGALEHALANNLHIVTGGPGTGKTTVLEAVVDKIARFTGVPPTAQRLPYLLVAPTGKAASRMQEQAKAPAQTIHMAFSILPDYGIPDIDRVVDKMKHIQYVIVDEASMLDSALFGEMCRVFERLPHPPKLLLVGDVDQLPPVQSGQVFHDILSYAKEHHPSIVTELTVVKRQDGDSNIPELAAFIRKGEFPEDSWFDDKDDIFKVVTTPPQFPNVLYKNVLEPKIDELDTFQNLTPYRNGDHPDTIHAINKLVAPLYNPPVAGSATVVGGNPPREYRVNDRVVNRRNLSQKVVNGSIGVITDIDTSPTDMFDWTITVQFDDSTIMYIYENWIDLEPAYAITIHASQGSEYNTVVLTMLRGNNRDFLTRNLLYTAITRASKRIVLIGTANTFKTIAATPQKPRQTALAHWLAQK